jgi:hypothetical protein
VGAGQVLVTVLQRAEVDEIPVGTLHARRPVGSRMERAGRRRSPGIDHLDRERVAEVQLARGVTGARADGGTVMARSTPMDHESADRVSAAAQRDPDSPTATTGFDERTGRG